MEFGRALGQALAQNPGDAGLGQMEWARQEVQHARSSASGSSPQLLRSEMVLDAVQQAWVAEPGNNHLKMAVVSLHLVIMSALKTLALESQLESAHVVETATARRALQDAEFAEASAQAAWNRSRNDVTLLQGLISTEMMLVLAHQRLQHSFPDALVPALPTNISLREVQRFARQLSNATFEKDGNLIEFDPGSEACVGGVLKLPDGTNFLNNEELGNTVYFRRDYMLLWREMQVKKKTAFVAQPGTGKSMGALALLCRLVQQGHTVAYRSKVIDEGACYVFRAGTVTLMPPSDALRLGSETWLISDTMDVGYTNCRTLLVTSPNENVLKMFGNTKRGLSTFFGSLWSMDELIAAQKLHSWVSVPVLHQRVALLGPIPRVVFAVDEPSFSNFVRSCIDAVNKYSVDGIFSALNSNTWDKFPHRILQLDRNSDGESIQKLASPWVASLIVEKVRVKRFTDLCTRFNDLRDDPKHAVSAGHMLEAIFHVVFPDNMQDCTHLCQECPGKQSGLAGVVADKAKVAHDTFKNVDHFMSRMLHHIKAGTEAVYFKPLKQNEAAVDGIYVDFGKKVAHLYQVTINRKHGIIRSVVAKWAAMFGEVFGFGVTGVYFITDDISYADMGQQRWKTKEREVCQSQRSPMCQYKVRFDYSSDAAAMDKAENDRQLGFFGAYIKELKQLHQSDAAKHKYVWDFTLRDFAVKKRKVEAMDSVEAELLDKAVKFIDDYVSGLRL